MHRGTLFAAGAAALVLFGAACGNDDTGTGVGRPASIRIVSGCTNAAAGAGLALTDPVVVQVLDSRGNPVANAAVTFAATTGGGSVSPTTATTNSAGQAQTTFTLGTTSGANVLTAKVAGVATGATCNATGLERFVTSLIGSNERPAVNSSGTGTADVTLDAAATTITYKVTFGGLADSAIAAHIHGPFDPANPGSGTAPVVLGFSPVPRDKSGTITGTAVKGTASLGNNVSWDSLLVLLRNGHSYVNVHSKLYPGGEIRGQLLHP